MVEKARDGQQNISVNFLEQAGFKPDATTVIKRVDLAKPDYPFEDKDERVFWDFLRLVATDPNLKGIGLSSMKSNGGVFITWIIGDHSEEKMRETFRIITASYSPIYATHKVSSAGNLLNLGDEEFEDVANKLRKKRTEEAGDLELMGIVKFE